MVARRSVGRTRVETIDNAVDLAKIPMVRRELRKGRLPEVVTLGRISAQKGPELFAEVASRVPLDVASFVWVGGGTPESESVLRTLPNVTVTGWLSREAALERLVDADVYLQTSHWEGMPLSVIEAMAAGLPAVVTDIVGNRDVVASGITGYIGSTADELACYVARLCTDEALRVQLGQQARHEAVNRFSLARFLAQWQHAYERSLSA
jgi:glycosyltransferase involved in cell wall biosynthesis